MIAQIYIFLASFLISTLMKIINKTLTFKLYGIDDIKENVMFAVWHNSTFSTFDVNPLKNMAALTAAGIKGDIFTRAIKRYNYKIIRVPYEENSRQSANAALQIIKTLKEGFNLVVALDGPKGPLFSIKPGIFYLSQKSKKKIVPVGAFFSRKISLSYRWDKYIIPMPFSKVSVYLDTNYEGKTEESLRAAMADAEKKAENLLID